MLFDLQRKFNSKQQFLPQHLCWVVRETGKLLRTSIEPRDTKYVCKICFRRAELLIKKQNVLDSLDSEFQAKCLSSAGSDTLKRLSKESPQRPIKKARRTKTDELPLRASLAT